MTDDELHLEVFGEDLPCGCRSARREVDGERRLIFRPCSLDCQFYRYAITESAARGNDVRFRAT